MDQETYDALKEQIEAGRIAEIGGRTAATVGELDWLRGIGAKEDGTTEVETTAATHTLTQEQMTAVIDAATASRDSHIADLGDEVERLNVRIDGLQDALATAGEQARAKDATADALQATVESQRGQIETQKALAAAQQARIDSQTGELDGRNALVQSLTAVNAALKSENIALKAPAPAEKPADKAVKQS